MPVLIAVLIVLGSCTAGAMPADHRDGGNSGAKALRYDIADILPHEEDAHRDIGA